MGEVEIAHDLSVFTHAHLTQGGARFESLLTRSREGDIVDGGELFASHALRRLQSSRCRESNKGFR